MLEPISITKHISYLKASENPLSADVGLIAGDSFLWLYDVGANPENIEYLESQKKPHQVILSHFHPDHIQNWDKISMHSLYQSKNTRKYTGQGEIVTSDCTIQDGISLQLFSIPCCHAKGSLGLEVNGEYAFLGDAIYPTQKNGKRVYNASLLYEEIQVLSARKASYFMVSHQANFVCEKRKILDFLQFIYEKRESGNPYISVSPDYI